MLGFSKGMQSQRDASPRDFTYERRTPFHKINHKKKGTK